MSQPCMRNSMECTHCGADPGDECPYESLSPGLSPYPQQATVIGGDCSGEDGVCESCQ